MPRLPAALIPIYGTTLVDLLGYTLMIPLLPYVAQLYGASSLKVGALLSVPAFCSMMTAPVWGKASDRWGRKAILLSSQAFSLTGYLLLAFSHSLPLMFASRIISGFGAGNLSAAQSYIADVTSPEERSQAFAIYGVIFGIGFVIGPAASGFLIHSGIAVPFLLAAALEVLNLIFTALFIPWHTRDRRTRTSVLASLRTLQRSLLRAVFIRQFLFIFAVVYVLGSFALFLRQHLHTDIANVGWLLAGAGLIGVIVQGLFVGPLVNALGERFIGQVGFALLFAAYSMLFFVTGLGFFIVMLVVWAVGAAMVEPTLMALMSKRTPKEERGAVMGLGDAFNGVALILAPLAGSAVVGADPRYLGVVPACVMLVAFFFGRRVPR